MKTLAAVETKRKKGRRQISGSERSMLHAPPGFSAY
jgi:hypothetical protein